MADDMHDDLYDTGDQRNVYVVHTGSRTRFALAVELAVQTGPELALSLLPRVALFA
jgi:hypothetical protein